MHVFGLSCCKVRSHRIGPRDRIFFENKNNLVMILIILWNWLKIVTLLIGFGQNTWHCVWQNKMKLSILNVLERNVNHITWSHKCHCILRGQISNCCCAMSLVLFLRCAVVSKLFEAVVNRHKEATLWACYSPWWFQTFKKEHIKSLE